MRETLFRGKRIDNGEWVDGDLLRRRNSLGCNTAIVYYDNAHVLPRHPSVDPETVGQYTGLKDSTGKRIYEGDIVKDGTGIGFVSWMIEHCCFLVKAIENGCITGYHFLESDGTLKYAEIIGNLHDNPELLEEV